MVIVTDCPTRRPILRSTDVPSTISWLERGGWPSSRTGASSGPRPAATPIAGTTLRPIPMIAWLPKDQPDTPGVACRTRSAARGVTPVNWNSTATSQLCP